MAKVIFYEKPGCANNTRQKALLTAAGHDVEARNLLDEPWTEAALLSFLGTHPVVEWFNRAAPQVKAGTIVPETLDKEQAMWLLLNDHLLIRRPLIEAKGRKEIGFNQKAIHAWLGLTPSGTDLESCPHLHQHHPCPSPPGAV